MIKKRKKKFPLNINSILTLLHKKVLQITTIITRQNIHHRQTHYILYDVKHVLFDTTIHIYMYMYISTFIFRFYFLFLPPFFIPFSSFFFSNYSRAPCVATEGKYAVIHLQRLHYICCIFPHKRDNMTLDFVLLLLPPCLPPVDAFCSNLISFCYFMRYKGY